MRNLAVLGVLILMSVQSIAQKPYSQSDKAIATKVLAEHGVNREGYTFINTPQGTYINSRTEDNTPVNYLYTLNNEVKIVDQLNGYIVVGYSPVSGELLMTKYQAGHMDSMAHEIFTYNPVTKKFVKQADFGWVYSRPKYNETYDSISVLVNEKNADGVGSHGRVMSAKVK